MRCVSCPYPSSELQKPQSAEPSVLASRWTTRARAARSGGARCRRSARHPTCPASCWSGDSSSGSATTACTGSSPTCAPRHATLFSLSATAQQARCRLNALLPWCVAIIGQQRPLSGHHLPALQRTLQDGSACVSGVTTTLSMTAFRRWCTATIRLTALHDTNCSTACVGSSSVMHTCTHALPVQRQDSMLRSRNTLMMSMTPAVVPETD